MFITVKSDNPEFSYLIGKNPASPPLVKSERKGVVCGWYPSNDIYCLNFIDAMDEVSYPDYKGQDFEYLSRGAYCSSFLAYKMLKEFFKIDNEYDAEHHHEIEITSLNIKESTIQLFVKYFPFNFDIISYNDWEKYRKVKISYIGSFEYLIECMKTFLFYSSLDNENYFVDEGLIIEQCKRIKSIDAPYFIRYLFKQNLAKNSKNKFDKIKEYLCDDRYKMCPYNNLESRIRFIQGFVQNENVYDIGCGEGNYVKRLGQTNKSYTGVDIDEEILKKAEKKSERVDIPCEFYSDMADIDDDRDKVVVCSEVIEHIPCDRLSSFFAQIKELANVKRIVLTTPNVTFNKNYEIDGFRHEDHKCEFTLNELISMVAISFPTEKVTYHDVGDIVDGQPTTFGVVIDV